MYKVGVRTLLLNLPRLADHFDCDCVISMLLERAFQPINSFPKTCVPVCQNRLGVVGTYVALNFITSLSIFCAGDR